MADADGTSSGRSRDGRVPSYEAPTTPMPVVRPDGDPVVTPRVPRRPQERADVQVSGPGRPGPEPAGPAKAASGGDDAGDAGGSGDSRDSGGSGGSSDSGDAAGPFRLGAPPAGRVLRRGLGARIADIPIRLVYSAGAAVVTVLAIFSVFALFSGDEPADPVPLRQPVPDAAPTAASAPPSASPAAAVRPRLPKPPRSKPLAALPGRASPVVGAVVDQGSGITYVRLGRPWADGPVPPFAAGQRVGGTRLPRTLAVSLPLPGRTPWTGPRTDAGFRAAALSAVRWALRNHYPPGARVAWTASQRPAAGRGWVLGYRVDYELGSVRRSSQAALALLETRRAEPAVFLVTVPDGRKRLWADIAPLVTSVRAL
ncbi:hypothetical protein Ppa06_16200 [Planomonospora parontospora subsp. parontospora]|uniref:Uncharacterized protein n=2 Tax=Planomonospora parontospora TaxID=58119 RepID=A0AA37BE78_9ACTN|nr:hypothetical protein [Planomonospora parontospora]GGK57876.1 hypothetical protein GCM10010126_16750 [Planomonospora parontospora]GII07822.1 hypothetical protein Ppa06_16200 [Planomonospora parontospora subsp. parontospora]